MIVEEAPAVEPEPEPDSNSELGVGVVPWLVSARSEGGLRAQAGGLLSHFEGARAVDPVNVGWSLLTGRAGLEHRAVVLGDERQGSMEGLEALAQGRPAANVVCGAVGGGDGRVVLVFPGQGSQWMGMGVELLDSSPVFAARRGAARFAECGRALAPFVDWSQVEALRGVEGAPSLDRVDVVQPVSWAVMVAVALPLVEIEARLARWDGRMSVAAVNGPSSVVVAGDPGALEELVARCVAEGVTARMIPVDYASHTSQVGLIRDDLVEVLAGLKPGAAQVPFFFTVEGRRLDAGELDGGYWYRNLRETVRFEEAIRALAADGFGCLWR